MLQHQPDPRPGAPPSSRAQWIAEAVGKAATRGVWHSLAAGVALAILVLAIATLYSALKTVAWSDVQATISGAGTTSLVCGVLFTAGSYLALVGYDLLALRHLGERRAGLATAAQASFLGQAFTYTLGFGLLTGGAIRMRIYSSAGMAPQRIAALVVFCAGTFWLGLITLGALALVASPDIAGTLDGLPPILNRGIGVAVLGALAAYLLWVGRNPRRIELAGKILALPGPATTFMAILLGAIDVGMAALALYVLLPSGGGVGFPAFVTAYVIAAALGVASHAPGGVGVFEAAMLVTLPMVPAEQLLGALLLFRLVYYIGPFLLASLMFAASERLGLGRVARTGLASLSRWFEPLLPHLCAAAVFAGGFTLLVSDDLPINEGRLDILRDLLPLPFVEVSHLFASIVGLVLLVVANGLSRRLANAWRIAVALLLAGAVFSIAKGIDYEEATGCILALLILLLGRRSFYRRVELFSERPSATWIVAIVTVVGASTWLGLAIFRDVTWQDYFLWEFGYKDDAPRFLRATLAVTVTAIAIGVYALIHHRAARLGPDSRLKLREIEPIVASSRRTEASLALLGDKRFLVNDTGDGFIMYGHQGQCIVAMGDPVADDAEAVRDLVWRFRELADRLHLKPVFYQVSIDHLPIYLDANLSLFKLGEEALVDLTCFTTEGGEGRRHRQALARAARNGLSYEVVPAANVEEIVDKLRQVSATWLAAKDGIGLRQEKGFSLGFWSEDYIRRHDIAVVRHERRVVAFANIWRSAGAQEASVDLMRFMPDAPAGVMDLMFIELMLGAKREGYHWFNLGMAPLSGLPRHRLTPIWTKLLRFAYRQGDSFFNFEGLRAFKQKYKPVWRPRYLAHPGGLSLPHVLIDCTRLIGASPARARQNDSAVDRSHGRSSMKQSNRVRTMMTYCTKPALITLFLALIGGGVFAWLSQPMSAQRKISIPTEDFGKVEVVAPGREPTAFVILLSDGGGLTPELEKTTERLVAAGAAVAPLSTPAIVTGLAMSNDGTCHYVFGDFEDISRDAQRALGVARYKWPVLVGAGEGGTLAYLAMAQAPVNTTAGAISIGFNEAFRSKLPMCPGAQSNTRAADGTFTYKPFERLPARWIAVSESLLNPERAAFVLASSTATSKVVSDLAGTRTDLIVNAVLEIGGPSPVELSDLPLVEMPTVGPPKALAVFYSGDGGWRDIDKEISDLLNRQGVAVIGVDSLRYFWTVKTPREVARDLDRIVATYQTRWSVKKTALLGYSIGAGTLPFAWTHLARKTQDDTTLIGLLGLAQQSTFQVSVSSLLGMSSPDEADVLPALGTLPVSRVLCFYGVDELTAGDTACGAKELDGAVRIERPGGHHFDGDYAAVAKIILDRL